MNDSLQNPGGQSTSILYYIKESDIEKITQKEGLVSVQFYHDLDGDTWSVKGFVNINNILAIKETNYAVNE